MGFQQWLEEKAAIEPKSADEMARAKHADLITLPPSVKGTNCANCRFVEKRSDGAFCAHPEIKLPVNERMCCAYWDHSDVKRPWGD